MTVHRFNELPKAGSTLFSCRLLTAVCLLCLATADEMHNLDLISVFKFCLLPFISPHHLFVDFHGNSLRRQGQRIDQFVERQRTLRKLARLAVDLNAHDGFESGGMNDAAQFGDFAVGFGANQNRSPPCFKSGQRNGNR